MGIETTKHMTNFDALRNVLGVVTSVSGCAKLVAGISLIGIISTYVLSQKNVEENVLYWWSHEGGKSVLVERTTQTSQGPHRELILEDFLAVGGKPCYMRKDYPISEEDIRKYLERKK